MNTNDFNQAMITIHSRVKDIMVNLGLKIHEKKYRLFLVYRQINGNGTA